MAGWMNLPMIWRGKVTPSGRRRFQLAVLGRSTKGSDYGLWPITTQNDDNMSRRSPEALQREWNRTGRGQNLALYATTALWPTADATNMGDGIPYPVQLEKLQQRRQKTKEAIARGEVKSGSGRSMSLQMAAQGMALLWPTPTSRDFRHGDAARWENPERSRNLNDAALWVNKALWLTPSANEDAAGTPKGKMQRMLTHQAKETASCGSHAPMESIGQLSPEFVFWLMGFPPAYLCSAQRGMLSIQGQRHNSSLPRAKP